MGNRRRMGPPRLDMDSSERWFLQKAGNVPCFDRRKFKRNPFKSSHSTDGVTQNDGRELAAISFE
jgi:hypothetical protein